MSLSLYIYIYTHTGLFVLFSRFPPLLGYADPVPAE